MARTVVFVCPHGALKSRLAAAYFNRVAPAGWQATSAGMEPAVAVNVLAGPLVAGTGVEGLLDVDPPRALSDLAQPERVVGVDCDVPGAADQWRLVHQEVGEAMRDELRRRAEELTRQLAVSDDGA